MSTSVPSLCDKNVSFRCITAQHITLTDPPSNQRGEAQSNL